MQLNLRRNNRFEDFAKVEIPALCVFPGILVDISVSGCKVRFPVEVCVEKDYDYELVVHTSRGFGTQFFKLIANPVWHMDTTVGSEVGFEILRSPGTPQMMKYIDHLAKLETEKDDAEMMFKELCLS